MRVHLGSDHAGFELKQHLVQHLSATGHEVVDHGPPAYQPQDDYPPYCLRTALAAVQDPGSLGIVIGGSGNGEQIAANKVTGVRAALAWSLETAVLARQHNDANVLAIGGRMHSIEQATSFADAYLAEPFSQDPRHIRRIEMLAGYEATGELPPLPAADADAATDAAPHAG